MAPVAEIKYQIAAVMAVLLQTGRLQKKEGNFPLPT